jgi:preprotein translocase SecE subunit
MFSRVIPFLKETKTEMKRVNWLTRKELMNFTISVIIFSLVVAVILGFFDFIFKLILNKAILM